MFGPLPALHRSIVVTLTVLAAVTCGAWLARYLTLSGVSAGALGAMVGILLAYVVVRDAREGVSSTRRLRAHRPPQPH